MCGNYATTHTAINYLPVLFITIFCMHCDEFPCNISFLCICAHDLFNFLTTRRGCKKKISFYFHLSMSAVVVILHVFLNSFARSFVTFRHFMSKLKKLFNFYFSNHRWFHYSRATSSFSHCVKTKNNFRSGDFFPLLYRFAHIIFHYVQITSFFRFFPFS